MKRRLQMASAAAEDESSDSSDTEGDSLGGFIVGEHEEVEEELGRAARRRREGRKPQGGREAARAAAGGKRQRLRRMGEELGEDRNADSGDVALGELEDYLDRGGEQEVQRASSAPRKPAKARKARELSAPTAVAPRISDDPFEVFEQYLVSKMKDCAESHGRSL